MTRRIFGWLFPVAALPAAAQTPVPFPGDGVVWRPKPKNGECPVCGTQAAAFRPNPKDYEVYGGLMSDAFPKNRKVICAHCRVHFEQDAEK